MSDRKEFQVGERVQITKGYCSTMRAQVSIDAISDRTGVVAERCGSGEYVVEVSGKEWFVNEGRLRAV